MDFIEVFVNSPLNKVSQLGKDFLTQQYKLPSSIYSEVIQSILHVLGAGIVPCKGSPLVRALLCVSAKRLHPDGVGIVVTNALTIGYALIYDETRRQARVHIRTGAGS